MITGNGLPDCKLIKKTDLLLYTQIMGLETSFSRIAAGFFNESDNLSKAVEHSGQLNYYGESMIKTAMERKGNPRIGGKMWDCF